MLKSVLENFSIFAAKRQRGRKRERAKWRGFRSLSPQKFFAREATEFSARRFLGSGHFDNYQ